MSRVLINALASSESLLFTGWPEKGLWEVPKPVSMMPTEVNSLCTNPRLLIAFHSPYALLETGLRMCPPEKSRDSDALHCRVVRSLQFMLLSNNREIRAFSAYFGGKKANFLCSFRLRGGAGRIRTLGTGLKPVRADVCVSCAESTSSKILRRRLLPNRHTKQCGFAKPLEAKPWRLCG